MPRTEAMSKGVHGGGGRYAAGCCKRVVIAGTVVSRIAPSCGSCSIVTLCCGRGSSGCCRSCQVIRGAGVRSIRAAGVICASSTLCCGNGGCWKGIGCGRRCVSSSASPQIHHDLYAGSTCPLPGGLVLDGPLALRRVWSFDLIIRLHSLLAWEKIHPWNQQYR